MITQRINQFECIDEDRAWIMCEGWKELGYKSWIKDCTVYWVEESTD